MTMTTTTPTMTTRRNALALIVILSGSGVVGACATPPPVAKPQIPSRPLDLQLPPEAPDEATMQRLPAAWDAEAAGAGMKIETGPLQGPGNFNEMDGPFASFYARSPYVVAEGADNERKLATRLPADAARPFMDEGNKAFGAGQLDLALASYRKVIEHDPLYAKAFFYVAEIETKRRDLEAATSWNDRGLRLSPRDAYGHALRAEILANVGRIEVARRALAYALALDPFAPRALKLLQRLGGTRMPGVEPPIFVQVQRAPGQAPVLVARGGGNPAWQQYAVCRGLLAYNARVRSVFIQSEVQARTPGSLSLNEETTCGYMATAAYRAQRGAGARTATPDADLDRWSRAYDANLLREAVIYETIGSRRPEVLPLLNDEELQRVAEYVRLFVVPSPPTPAALPPPRAAGNGP